MKTLRIHILWALFTLGTAVVWGTYTAGRAERRVREGLVPGGRVPATESLPKAQAIPVSKSPDLPSPPTPPTESSDAPPSTSADPLDPEAIRRLFQSSELGDRPRAFELFRKVSDRKTKLDLLKSAAGASDDYTLHHVLIELGRLGGPEAGEALIQILKSDCKGWVKQRAAGGLGNTGGPGALEALLEAYRTDSFYLQVASAGAMHRLGYSGPLTEMLPKIGTMLDNPDGSVRRDATEQLRQLTSPQAIPLLTRALQDSNGDVRIEAIRMLSTGKVPGSLALLEKMLADPNPDVVESAKSAMLTLRQASDNKER